MAGKRVRKRPSPARVKALLDYNPRTGAMRWKVDRGNAQRAGDLAGYTGPAGYVVIGIDRATYPAHQLAFVIMTGRWPPLPIDHRQGMSNRWSNLRLATYGENGANRRAANANSSTGARGVYRAVNGSGWRIALRFDRGGYRSKQAAALARAQLEAVIHGAFAGGR